MKTKHTPPPQSVIMQMLNGKHISRAISLMADLGIADLLKDGPQSVAYLAEKSRANEDALHRVLRTLSSMGVFTQVGDKTYQNNSRSATLQKDVPGSVHNYARWMGTDFHWNVIRDMPYTINTGRAAVLKGHESDNPFDVLKTQPEAQEIFNEAMSGMSRADGQAIAAAFDWSAFRTVMDIGGGHGTLATILAESNPETEFIVFDMPHVIKGTQKHLDAAALPNLRAIAGNFFEPIPGEAELIVMKNIIHDWDDKRAVQILENCKAALAEDGKIILCEMLITDGPESIPAKIFDLEMLLGPGGRERTAAEFEELFAQAGLKLNRIIPTGTQIKLIEGF